MHCTTMQGVCACVCVFILFVTMGKKTKHNNQKPTATTKTTTTTIRIGTHHKTFLPLTCTLPISVEVIFWIGSVNGVFMCMSHHILSFELFLHFLFYFTLW